jgi:hypothetical protein
MMRESEAMQVAVIAKLSIGAVRNYERGKDVQVSTKLAVEAALRQLGWPQHIRTEVQP